MDRGKPGSKMHVLSDANFSEVARYPVDVGPGCDFVFAAGRVAADDLVAAFLQHCDGGEPDGVVLIPPSVRKVLRLLRITALPRPRRDRDHVLHWSAWHRHQHQAAQAHPRWNNITPTATTWPATTTHQSTNHSRRG